MSEPDTRALAARKLCAAVELLDYNIHYQASINEPDARHCHRCEAIASALSAEREAAEKRAREAEAERDRWRAACNSRTAFEQLSAAESRVRELREQLAASESALEEIARHRCASGTDRAFGERCPESWALAMGGTIPQEEQRRRWCASCIARDALRARSAAPPKPDGGQG